MPLRQSLTWAAAIVLTALGNAAGVIEDHTAQTLFVIFPALAVVAMYGGGCRLRRDAA